MGAREALARYHGKRDFTRTPEPRTGGRKAAGTLQFVVQKHHASHLHYDFRLELDGTLKSWAVPKGPCLDPTVKRMAVQVEDHPLSYANFEGTIPPKQYGAGTVIVWDRGAWLPEGNAREGLAAGKLKFELRGDKLHGHWTLVRMHGKASERQPAWLLIKEHDDAARPLTGFDVLEALPDSVLNKPAPAALPEQPREDKAADAPRRALPAKLAPQLATLADGPPAEPEEWLYELKFDGYRLLTRIEGKSVQCFTRNGHDWSAKLPELVAALKKLGARSAWLDGEIVVDSDKGAPDFQALQNAFDSRATGRIAYWLFDLLFLDGRDLRGLPLEQRRSLLAELLGAKPAAPLRLSEAFDVAPRDLLASAAKLGFEGIVGKRKGSTYQSKRSPDWIKLKQHRRQEFVIGGYTAPKGSRAGFGALLLGVYDAAGKLQYCGNVGTGFDAKRLADIEAKLAKLHAKASPFAAAVPASVKAQWVRPQLVAEVSFGEWTREGRIRHSVFQGLRSDKPAHEIVHEEAQKMKAPPKLRNVSHADRVIDPQSGATKGDLYAYYQATAELMLPHLRKRPVSLVRAPAGVGGELFFQKHAQSGEMADVKLLDPALDPGHEPLLQIDTAKGLLSAAQMNTIELHTWNATSDAIDKPDRMTFDLDPGEGVPWPQVQEAALLVQVLLKELGLPAFLKTSGGKGLHVVVPLRRAYGWDAVKDFSQAVVAHLADTIPARFVAKSGPKNRVGKIFVDYLRNGFGATTASAWSVRARPGLGISVPVRWEELPDLGSGAHWTLANIAGRMAQGNQPWAQLAQQRAGLASAMRRLGHTPREKPRRS
ncbi:DNA ligase D [Variovorax fucosicus]|uniref:DNA ligase D n=1 Tax=Variovorax fucosicus TaxID=3053517 RepID=UPI00257530D1|nr:DNA ligase D [Variovorax sp. J22G47]MDM0054699.1 DNA ligase D [Variovorax sp. J22G47]